MVVLAMFQLKSEATICARVSAWFVEVDEDFGVTEWSAASVTSRDSGFGQTDWFFGDHIHCAEGLGLEVHGRLLEARTGRRGRPRTLALRP